MEGGARRGIPELASQAEVTMNGKEAAFQLQLAELPLEAKVDLARSRQLTSLSAPSGNPRFVFIAGSLWLRTEGEVLQVSDEAQNGNLLEVLKTFLVKLESPAVPKIEDIIDKGRLGMWFAAYWERMRNDTELPDDERVYALLSPLCVVAEGENYLAVYRYGAELVVEVGVAAPIKVNAWSLVKPLAAVSQVESLITAITREITRHGTA